MQMPSRPFIRLPVHGRRNDHCAPAVLAARQTCTALQRSVTVTGGAHLERLEVAPHVLRDVGGLVHVALQLPQLPVVALQAVGDGPPEVVDGGKVGEQRQDVLDLSGGGRLKQ